MTHKILTGIYDESCTAVKKPYTVIRLGDFVEVVAGVEIVKYRKYQRWITEVRLILQEVLRICDKNTVMVGGSTFDIHAIHDTYIDRSKCLRMSRR